MSSIPGDFLFGSTVYFEEVEGFGGVSVKASLSKFHLMVQRLHQLRMSVLVYLTQSPWVVVID